MSESNSYRDAQNMSTEQIILIVISVVGLIGNLLVCLAIFLDKKLQNITNYFLFSLAVTDLIISAVVLPLRVAMDILMLQPNSFIWCYIYLVGDDFMTTASALHICFISLERYFAIKDPLKSVKPTRIRNIQKIALVWILSFLSVIGYTTILLVSKKPQKESTCNDILIMTGSLFNIIALVEALVIYIMIIIVTFSFIATAVLLQRLVTKQKKNEKERGGSGMVRTVGGKKPDESSKHIKKLQSEQKALRVVWLISFAFITCMFPYTLVNTLFLFRCRIPTYVATIAAYLNYMNSFINPIIYTIFNKTFRHNFLNIIMCKFANYKVKKTSVSETT